ncbi:glycosyltransferase family 2 protein [Flavobacterium sp. HNIBRBA15423]|uniref:glycosyltransferase family 2 protein n=1 Tax=Flavobacterium sp. HNIBRBA15423 TaxID=3458683 RepID=UPI004043A56E
MNVSNPNVLVSVIIPVYNVEKFISEAIESVLNQSFESIEIILVDDGSNDNSLIICEQYLYKDSRIKLIKQKNFGVSIARNNGLNSALGEYIFFMDSDDTIDSEFISTSYNIAKKKDSDIVIIGDYYCKRLPNISALPTCALFLKHSFLKKHFDIRFPKNIQPCEDGLFSHQLLALTHEIAENPSGIYNYREHDNQNHIKINNDTDKLLTQIPIWFKILEDFYNKYNLYNSHAFHFALFLEHEPFELRYIAMPISSNQKEYLHKLIKDFYQKNVNPYINMNDRTKLSKLFLVFLASNDYKEFEKYHKRYLLNLKIKFKFKKFLYKFKLKLINIIPISKYRRSLRNKIKIDL